jgi:hypothetical protein
MKGFLAFLMLVVTVVGAQARPDLNAFLNKRAPNLRELISQVKADRIVMDRYCRHYQMTPDQVIAHLKKLRPGMITKPEMYSVYSVPAGGAIKCHFEVLKRGTPVYLGEDGKPELVALCGNPLRAPVLKADILPDVVGSQEEEKDVDVMPIYVAQMAEPDVQAPLIETFVETPQDEIATAGDSAIPLASFNAASLLFPVSLFAVTTDHSTTSTTPSPAAAIPFVLGAALMARRRIKSRR